MATIFAAPTTRSLDDPWRTMADGTQRWAFDLQTALNRARPGDCVLLLPGRYTQGAVLHRGGTPDAPITLRPAVPDSVILDGMRHAHDALHAGMDPLDGDFAMLKAFSVAHVLIEGLRFQNCWPTVMYLRSARHVTIRNCAATDGRYFIYLRQHDDDPTHHITIEGCTWVQDKDHDLRRGRITWKDVKRTGTFDASYLNGGFLGGFDVQGQIILRGCTVSHVFNVVRLDIRPERVRADGTVTRNRDVAIYDNRFGFVRDNVIEPEAGMMNWRVFNNQIYAAHATVSLDLVQGRDLFFVGNTILNDHRPGRIGADGSDDANDNQGRRIVKVLKTKSKEPLEDREGVYLLHNSILTRTSYSKKGQTRQLLDAFTLLGMLPTMHPQSDAVARVAFDKMAWSGITLHGMVSDAQGFPDDLGAPAGSVTGTAVARVFERPPMGAQAAAPDHAHPLGGWAGHLTPTPQAARHVSTPLTLPTRNGPLALPGGVRVGAVDVDDLGLGHWRAPWPDGDVPVG